MSVLNTQTQSACSPGVISSLVEHWYMHDFVAPPAAAAPTTTNHDDMLMYDDPKVAGASREWIPHGGRVWRRVVVDSTSGARHLAKKNQDMGGSGRPILHHDDVTPVPADDAPPCPMRV
jgi:hypothetical protein